MILGGDTLDLGQSCFGPLTVVAASVWHFLLDGHGAQLWEAN